MIKITKPGQKEFHGFCDRCGCEFTYEIIDLKLSAVGNKVHCPTCGKDYTHPTMIQNPTLQTGIGYQWPSDSTDPCARCVWRENLLRDGIYVGDTPCTWCNKNKFNSINCTQPSQKDYTTPCVNQPDTYLNETKQQVYNATEVSKAVMGKIVANSADTTAQETVMNTILECCHSCTKDLNKCGDTEGRNSCSGEHQCGGKKNCKGKH